MTKEKKKQIEACLKTIADRHDGKITPQQVVDEARDPSSPLHSEFTWDDAIAADKYRLEQARTIIVKYKCVVTETTVSFSVPAYVRDPEAKSDEQGYVATATLRDKGDLAREAVRNELKRVLSSLERARSVAAGLDMAEELEYLISKTTELRAYVAAKAA